ncbi:diguanylate cyclase [Rhodocyclus tenuis]|uniref:sensor domain-containing diguanylate cyclase n=1 Tax=Rhodocyclus tenuis TaxID=1066 RepID=UPI001903BE34|nr:diguanylate cyclase [Rhodocyclus tenuis]MBK1681622.1 hypothetical protein [Rhodocyclus tenuis]
MERSSDPQAGDAAADTPAAATAISAHVEEIERLRGRLRATEREHAEVQAALAELQLRLESEAPQCNQFPAGCCTVDADGHLSFVNRAAMQLLGLTSAKPGQRKFASLFGKEAQTDLADFLARVFAGEAGCSCELALAPNRRRERRVLLLLGQAGGDTRQCHLALLDISRRKRTEQREQARSKVLELLASDAPLREILEAIVLGVESSDGNARASIMLLDRRGDRLFTGAAPNLPDFFCESINGMDIGIGQGCCGTAAFTGKRVVAENIALHPYWRNWSEVAERAGLAACWSQPIPGASRKILGAFAVYYPYPHQPTSDDLWSIEEAARLSSIAIERHRDAEALRASEERWKFAIDGSGDALFDWDIGSGSIFLSPRWYDMFGYPQNAFGDVLGEWRRRIHAEDIEAVMECLERCLDGNIDNYVAEYRLRCRDGNWKWTLARGLVVSRHNDGSAARMIGTQSDISERKRMEDELRELATTDVLTGLANRRRFIERISEEHARLQRDDGLKAAVLMLDLDHFKKVNDRFGHAVGDAMLVHFTGILRGQLRRFDTAGRLGGEEFAVLLPGASIAAARSFASRLRRAVESAPLGYKGQNVGMTVSIGLSSIDPGDPGSDTSLLRADAALYEAKSAGRNRVVVARNDA